MKERLPEKLRGGKNSGCLLEDAHRQDSDSGDTEPRLLDTDEAPATDDLSLRSANTELSGLAPPEGVENSPRSYLRAGGVQRGAWKLSDGLPK